MAINVLLWGVVCVLGCIAVLRSRVLFREAAKGGAVDFVRLIPRLAIGVLGSGFLAEVLPQDIVGEWLGPNSGFTGTLLASLAGALTPGGPMVGFALGAAALKGGAAAPQVIAYSTAWALFALHRLVLYEIPMMPARVVWLRALVSLPLPFLAA